MTYYSLGYTKDAIAVIGFIGAFILVYRTRDLQKVKSIILTSLLFAIIIDGLFTACPCYHHHNIGYNIPTYLLLISIIAFIPIVFQFFKMVK